MVPCISKKWCQAAIGCAGCDFNLSLRAGSIQEPLFFNAALSFFSEAKKLSGASACGHLCLFPACILALMWWCSAECTRRRGHMSWATVLFLCACHRSMQSNLMTRWGCLWFSWIYLLLLLWFLVCLCVCTEDAASNFLAGFASMIFCTVTDCNYNMHP